MRLNPFFLPVLAIGALLGTVWAAQALGQWSISGRADVDLEQLTPADLKGWMTLQQVMDGLTISQTDLYALMAIPAEIPPETALKDLEPLVPDFEIVTLRDKLAAWQAGGPASEAPLPVPPSPTPLPAVTATPAPAALHAGTGPTPLPAGQVLPADQIKGRLTLAEVSAQCAVPLDQLLQALQLPAETDPALPVKDLIAQGRVADLAAVQAAVAALAGR